MRTDELLKTNICDLVKYSYLKLFCMLHLECKQVKLFGNCLEITYTVTEFYYVNTQLDKACGFNLIANTFILKFKIQ